MILKYRYPENCDHGLKQALLTVVLRCVLRTNDNANDSLRGYFNNNTANYSDIGMTMDGTINPKTVDKLKTLLFVSSRCFIEVKIQKSVKNTNVYAEKFGK